MTSIGLRPATPADSEFCYRLHKAALGPYVTAVWGWDEQAQRDFHTRAFTRNEWQIITVDGTDAGMLHVERRPTEIYLGRIEIHPDHQGHGIGSYIVRTLLNEARRHGRRLTLDVLAVNQRAKALYERLGLQEESRHGENDIRIRMRSDGPHTR